MFYNFFVWIWRICECVLWPSSFIRNVTNTPTEQTMHFPSCSVDAIFWLFLMFKRWFNFRFAITVFELCVCVLKWPFYFAFIFDSTRICEWVLMGMYVCESWISGCFLFVHTTSASTSSSIILERKKNIVVTLLLFLAAFSMARRKIQKGKVQRIFSFSLLLMLIKRLIRWRKQKINTNQNKSFVVVVAGGARESAKTGQCVCGVESFAGGENWTPNKKYTKRKTTSRWGRVEKAGNSQCCSH